MTQKNFRLLWNCSALSAMSKVAGLRKFGNHPFKFPGISWAKTTPAPSCGIHYLFSAAPGRGFTVARRPVG